MAISGRGVELTRQTLRVVGTATWWARPVPDFLVIGAKRGGTTTAYFALLEHPLVLPLFPSGRLPGKRTHTKGVHYFDSTYHRSPRWYRGHFPTLVTRWAARHRHGAAPISGEASPYSLFHPLAAQRASDTVPAIRLLAILRDPVERTYSHYREQVRNGVETLSFEDALAAEDDRMGAAEEQLAAGTIERSFAHENQSYRRQSEYGRALRRWLSRFPAGQVLVLASEDFYADMQTSYDEMTDFLGLPRHRLTGSLRMNAAPSAPLAERTRGRLRADFAADRDLLERQLGRAMPWPST